MNWNKIGVTEVNIHKRWLTKYVFGVSYLSLNFFFQTRSVAILFFVSTKTLNANTFFNIVIFFNLFLLDIMERINILLQNVICTLFYLQYMLTIFIDYIQIMKYIYCLQSIGKAL